MARLVPVDAVPPAACFPGKHKYLQASTQPQRLKRYLIPLTDPGAVQAAANATS